MRKKIFLWFVLIILLILMGILSWFKFFSQKINNTDSSSQHVGNQIITYSSYRVQTFSDDGILVEDKFDDGCIISIDERVSSISICIVSTDSCLTFTYKKENGKYIETSEDGILSSYHFQIMDDTDENNEDIIKLNKVYYDEEGGYSIFYFKRSDEESSE